MYPRRKPYTLFGPSRTVYKSTTIRLDGEEKGAICKDSKFGEKCCFGNTTKQRFISAKISYDIFFTDDIRLVERLMPVTLFTKDEIESFLNYLKNVVDFEFTVEYGQVKDFDLFKNDGDFVYYLENSCKDTKIDYRELTGFLLHVTINAVGRSYSNGFNYMNLFSATATVTLIALDDSGNELDTVTTKTIAVNSTAKTYNLIFHNVNPGHYKIRFTPSTYVTDFAPSTNDSVHIGVAINTTAITVNVRNTYGARRGTY